MAIGLGIALLVVGLILVLGAVDLPQSIDANVATDTVGWIFVVVGALAIIVSLIVAGQRSGSSMTDRT